MLDTAVCVGDTEEGWGDCGVACTFVEGEGDGVGTTAAVLRDKNN